MRDSQRSKVYKAGNQVDRGQEFSTVSQIQDWVDKITLSKWWAKQFPNAPTAVLVKDGRGRRHAGTRVDFSEILLPRWARYQNVILHELAHITNNGRRDVADHGREFARAYLALVGRWMGAEHQQILRTSYREFRVKWCRPRN